jgi:glucose-1-phosphate thymidylyltransferase
VKALVLCAGLGTRLRPFTFSTAKHLIPVANKPVLFHVVEALRDAGCADVGVVVSHESRAPIQAALGDGAGLGVHVTYIDQPSPRGLAHATACGRAFVGDESFLLYLGDTLLPEGLRGLVAAFAGGAAAAVMLKPVDDPKGFGIAVVDGDRVLRLVEKSHEPPSNLAIAGAYAFTSEIFSSIERLEPSWRGEYEITDALQDLIDRGREVRAFRSPGWWKDAGNPEDLIDANSAMLDALVGERHGHVDARSRLEGVVVLGKGSRVVSSVLRGPVIVGAGAVIEDAEVGPHVSVGDHARIARSRLRESLVMRDALVIDVAEPLARCVIGQKAEVRGGAATRLIIGDQCRVRLRG